ncbi:MAG: cadherin-like domain-containing protein [Anaerolineales bacterium]|nr:cadherin-like domain-containing protein [Anaerolineales bacterium]
MKGKAHTQFHAARHAVASITMLVTPVLLLLLTGILFVSAQPALPEAQLGAPNTDSLRIIYILAFDNMPDTDGVVNLTHKYTDTVNSIVNATAGYANVTAVILADLDQDGDTHILVAQNGSATAVSGLPNPSGVIDPALAEYDTTDGLTLGGFLLWADQQYPATKRILSYLGHGAPLGPDSSPPIADIVTGAARTPDAIPMPLGVDANPDFTDSHVPGATTSRLLTPHALAQALNIATNSGASKINVLDLVHCFAASIEELTEVAPYADATVAAPNYAFFDPTMTGAMLADQAADLTMTSIEMANSVVGEYASVLPPNRHPHVLISVDNSLIPPIKPLWDALAQDLLDALQANQSAATGALTNAYLSTASTASLYDTSFCNGSASDFTLGPPDALADMGSLTTAIAQAFIGVSPDVVASALQVQSAINSAITFKVIQNGQPWWDPTPSNWSFNAVQGISIFTPFQPMTLQGAQYHAWQSLWYTHTTVIATDVQIGGQLVNVLNPHPYAFITPVGGGATWADVLDAYWRVNQIHPRQDVATALCLPEVREIEEPDLKVSLSDSADPVQATLGLDYTLRVVNKSTLATPNVVVTTTLPAGVSFTSASLPGCQHQAGVVSCALGSLAGHDVLTITVNTTVDVATVGPVTAVATIHTSANETRLFDNRSSQETTILSAWTLSLGSSVSQSRIDEGGIVTMTAVLENTGRAATTNTILQTNLPANAELFGPITITPAGAGTPGTLPILANLATMNPGEQIVVSFPLRLLDGPAATNVRISLSSSEVGQPISRNRRIDVDNVAPAAQNDVYVVHNDESLTPTRTTGVLANDADTGPLDVLSAALNVKPPYGVVLFNPDGSFAYSPQMGFVGSESFVYVVKDDDGGASSATVTVEVWQHVYLPISIYPRP